jgi:2-keto-4-pentenoate hydratase/2-oxohepta-3-ene-1,7-dioic acid hydratase in catechol pathway
MRFVSFTRGRDAASGVIEGMSVRQFRAGLDLGAFIALAPAQRAAELKNLGGPISLDEVHFLAPVRPHKNVFCVGRNYLAHAEEGARARGQELKLPDVPTFFTKAPTAIANPDQVLELDPKLSSQYDWEAELAVVIGTRCRDVSEKEALDVIFGYSCLNDVTARDLQKAHVQWFKGKSLDNTCPIGPWIVEASDIPDPQKLEIALTVNGAEKQHSNTDKMIFSIGKIIESLSAGLTLEPGDVIATGTPEGVGFARTPPEFLNDGDVMEITIQNVGSLKNSVRLSAPVASAR